MSDFQKYLEEQLKDPEFKAMWEGENAWQLYALARRVSPAQALNMARNAGTEEERNFWAYISDMNLQRKQKEVIEKGLF